MRVKAVIITLSFVFFPCRILGQTPVLESLFTDSYTIDAENEGKLQLCIDNVSFLKNNEMDGDILKGYTLPGFRIHPRLVYYPASVVRLEAGVSLLRYWGADKYPNFAYKDISEWKADGYQYGFHVLPFFRAQIQPSPQINIVLGDIFGGGNHRLISPLYNPELNFSADPELGLQFIYDARIAHVDTWVNWESFTFKDDSHNEAVTLGFSGSLHLTTPKSSFYVGIPVQALLTHRGGEIDLVRWKILTLANGGAGIKFGYHFDHSAFKSINLEMMGVGYESFSSEADYLPFKNGWAFYSNMDIQVWQMNLKMAFWRSGKFINMFGNPIFGNVSTSIEDRTFPRTMVLNPGLKYEQAFGKGFYLGADVDFFYNPDLIAYHNSLYTEKTSKSFSWTSGIYLRINPSIVLKK
jgi:hypothetical protein